jgi:predicted RNA-binding protein with PUA-like domain
MQFWLMKTEPGSYSIDDLAQAPDLTTSWDGVRNFQARNFMRDAMKSGDLVLFYHSVKKPGVVGIAKVTRESYPDHTAWNPESAYYDPRSTPEKPLWFMVDVQLVEKFEAPVPLSALRTVKELEGMVLLQKGSRLSVMPVAEEEFKIINRMAKEQGTDR